MYIFQPYLLFIPLPLSPRVYISLFSTSVSVYLLCMIDRVPDELWNEVCDIVQETGIKTIPMEKWQPTPVFLPGESQGRGSLVGCRLWGRTVGYN